MKKYFAVAFVILVILLLVLRKQTEPEKWSGAGTSSPPPVAATVAAAAQPADSAQPAVAEAVQLKSSASPAPSEKLSPEALQKLRSMAKNYLASSYTAQAALKAEWDRYSSDLVAMGWEPNEPEMNFKLGFLAPLNEKPYDDRERPERFSSDAFVNQDGESSNQKFRYTPAAEKIRLGDYSRYCTQGCVATPTSFEWMIVVPLDEKHVDVWTMNEKKELKLALDGSKD